jgi:ATP-dependent DNA ligase
MAALTFTFLWPVVSKGSCAQHYGDSRRPPQPFSHDDWLFEVKYDGVRPLAYCDP